MPTVPVSSMETSSSRESLDPPLDPPLASPEPMSSEIQRPPSISSNSSCGRHSSFTVPRPSSAPGYLSKKSGTRSSLEKVYSEEKHASSQTNLGQVRRIHEHLSEDEFDDDTDFLEFRLSNDTGIMRAFEDPTSTPQVIRYSKNRGDLRSSEESRLSAQVERPEYMWNSSNHSLDTLSRKSLPEKDREVSSASHGNTDKHEVQPLSEFSHQTIVNSEQQPSELLAAQIPDEGASKSDEEWQDMKTVGSYDIYDDKGRVVVHKNLQEVHENEENGQINAAKGYTRIAVDDDAKSVTSIDENTAYLFDDEDDLSRNPIAQLQMTKELLTDSQKIAYVGLCRIVMNEMAKKIACIKPNRHTTSGLSKTQGSLAMWTQRIMNRLYLHMDLSAEEQLSQHGVIPDDLSPSLRAAATVNNPMMDHNKNENKDLDTKKETPLSDKTLNESPQQFNVQRPEELRNKSTLDIDIRWTVLCDLFLILLSDSVYDSRSRTMLELVAEALNLKKLDIAQFEKKVSDAMEIEESGKQTWNEDEIMETRRKTALKKKYTYIGLATLGGGLVIGLSAGLLAPVIGAGLAAGFTTIGVTGTTGFLAGAGGAAIVTTTGAAVGARIGSKGMARRMGHVKTFEFRPLHNNKRVNLIITVSGWMSGKEDDVRLPFSTVDPIMGDLFSVLWEPEMLQSMGQTINILATEVLTQSVQQLLGQTVLVALMASLQLPMALSKLGYLLDNPWSVSLDRAWASGLILADTLINRNLGGRPVTLVGFSLGARLVYSCLVELARRGAYGLVQDVFIFGAPVVFKRNQFVLARTVVSGRFVNGFSKKDWILGYLFRATSGGLGRVFGLAPINAGVEVENFDNTDLVEGHMGYRKAIPRLLNELGWEVISEEFSEIEDPDPEGHRERQRELIMEFDDARKQMEVEVAKQQSKQKKSKIFSWMKPKRKEWWDLANREAIAETEAQHKKEEGIKQETGLERRDKEDKKSTDTASQNEDGVFSLGEQEGNVMFDLDAIKKEIENIEANPVTQKAFKEGQVAVPTGILAEVPLGDTNNSVNDPITDEKIEMSFDDTFEDDELERHGNNTHVMSTSKNSIIASNTKRTEFSGDDYMGEENVTMTFD